MQMFTFVSFILSFQNHISHPRTLLKKIQGLALTFCQACLKDILVVVCMVIMFAQTLFLFAQSDILVKRMYLIIFGGLKDF